MVFLWPFEGYIVHLRMLCTILISKYCVLLCSLRLSSKKRLFESLACGTHKGIYYRKRQSVQWPPYGSALFTWQLCCGKCFFSSTASVLFKSLQPCHWIFATETARWVLQQGLNSQWLHHNDPREECREDRRKISAMQAIAYKGYLHRVEAKGTPLPVSLLSLMLIILWLGFTALLKTMALF